MNNVVTDLRPRLLILAKDHSRGEKATGVKVNNIDDLLMVANRLRRYGYQTVQTFPVSR